MSSRILPLVAVVALALTAVPSQAQQHAQHAATAAKLNWGPAPPFLPAGARFALVSGDPMKSGPFEIRLDLPSGYMMPPHTHPTAETVTVKSGHFVYGMGDKVDKKGREDDGRRQERNDGAEPGALGAREGPHRRRGHRQWPLRHHVRESGGRSEEEEVSW